MQDTFLHNCINTLVERYGAQLGDVCIVVPNRRAGLFIRNIIAEQANGPVWAPDIFSQDDFMAHLSGFTVADRLTQLFYFYEVYKEMEGENARVFADFIHWAPTLLADFNEIDQYLANPTSLFSALDSVKAIELWNPGGSELTDFQKRYLHFWNQLQGFYFGLIERLTQDGLAYQGMAYRRAAEHIERLESTVAWKKVFFLGFNALTTAEEKVMKYLAKIHKAEIFWDADDFYLENPNHEAGKFLRKYRGIFGPEFNWSGEHLRDKNKEIDIIGVSGNAAQAKLAGKLIEDLAAANGGIVDGTALVLADEGLLLPVLNSLPRNVDTINVTMGYPLKYTPVASFIDAIFSLHLNSIKFSEGRSEVRYYHKDVAKVVSHPLFNILAEDMIKPTEVTYSISRNNYVFLNQKLLSHLLTEDIKNLMVWKPVMEAQGTIAFVEHLDNIVLALKEKLLPKLEEEPAANLTLEYLYTYYRYLQKLKTLLAGKPLVTDLQTLRLLFNQLISTSTLPFYGEPLTGLQIMGMLETRTLDFENVILLSTNEGILPQGKSGHTFIPFDVKREYELPTYSDKDSIFGYHFYRLLQRAKKVWILYNSQTDGGIGSKERSRFITQLVNELKGPKITESVLEIPLGGADENVIEFNKTPDVLEKLQELGEKGFSPSALNTFIRCPLEFYFRYIAGLKENEEVQETFEADTMGTMVHSVLEKLFTPFIGNVLKPADVELMQQQAPVITENVFETEFGKDDYLLGKNLLIYRVSKRFIDNFLVFQKDLLNADIGKGFDTVVTDLERKLEAPITIGNRELKVAGNADRIEQAGDEIRVIDYKTGKVDSRELKFGEWANLLEFADYAKSFQLLTYAWLYSKNTDVTGKLRPSIVAFTKLSEGFKECVTPNEAGYITANDLAQFENVLKTVIGKLFDTAQTFYQTPVKDNCRYCIYNSICNRN